MKDGECVEFLQWALPRLHMRWPGFRKVRGQVCKRLQQRIGELGLENVVAYRTRLECTPAEWALLDGLCRVTISRFYRDKMVFAFLEQEVLPALCQTALARGEHTLRVWSGGCGSGEEPYTVSLLWALRLAAQFPGLTLHVLATDADPVLIERAGVACYPYSSIKNLPGPWREAGFEPRQGLYCLKSEYRGAVAFACHDLRSGASDGPFDLILCRNLAFTYFDSELQLETARRLRAALVAGGALVLGVHEVLPEGVAGFSEWSKRLVIYRRDGGVVG